MAVLADGPAGERLDALLDASIQRLETDIYYFGIRVVPGLKYSGYETLAHNDVLDKLTAWKEGEPKTWVPRAYKPYFSKPRVSVPAGLVGGVTRGGVKGASSASP